MLSRPRLRHRIARAAEYPLTILYAGAGYGKTTLLATLSETDTPLVWYHLGAEDADPRTFLAHLLAGFRQAFPAMPTTVNALLETWDGGNGWETIIDVLANALTDTTIETIFLILDDTHNLNRNADTLEILNRLIARAPQNLHIILSTRAVIRLPDMVNWKLTDQILELYQSELAFTPTEIAEWFNGRDGLSLTENEINSLAKETHGWAIALQLVRQGLHANPARSVTEMLSQFSVPNQDIFAYLAQNVLQQQSPTTQEFLLTTAVLPQMTVRQCDCLRAANDSAVILQQLVDDGLFIDYLGGGIWRYHALFHNFLKHKLATETAQTLHRRAAACCTQQNDSEGAVHHLLQAGDFETAATHLDRLGRSMVWSGRLDTLTQWITLIPQDIITKHPALLICRGDIARLHSQFDTALDWYRRAETLARHQNDLRGVGRSLRGQARVYLDTVNPAKAEKLLEEALQLMDVEDDQAGRTRLLNLLAENMLNLGQPTEAERFRAQADALQPETPHPVELTARVLLRTGQLHLARQRLRDQLLAERQHPVHRPRGHREPLLLLSLIESLMGNQKAALDYAEQGIDRGTQLNAPFITAVGYIRQGHTYLLQKTTAGYRQAITFFEKGLAIGDTLMVPRLKPESFWGLCQAYGFQGDINAARVAAEAGIEIVRQAGDEWLEGFIRLTMGAGYVWTGDFDRALDWLHRAENSFHDCSDPFGETLVYLWQTIIWHKTRDTNRLTHTAEQLLQHLQTHQYDFLFTRKTLLGPPDTRQLIPILLHAKQNCTSRQIAARLLDTLGMGQIERHAGYRLQIETLGHFTVSRGNTPLSPQDWQRIKSRRLFQLFITHFPQMISRDQILEYLWLGVPPEKARRDFKVALSTLNRVLEPEKARRAPSAFIARDGDAYGLHPHADISLDSEIFIRHIEQGDAVYDTAPIESLPHYRRALALYHADYLPDAIYDDWSSEKREQLLALFLRTAERVARIQATQGEWETVIRTCETILARDDCWEEAYRLMMTAYAKLGNRAQVLRTYRHCTNRMQTSLGLAPSPETVAVFRELSQSDV